MKIRDDYPIYINPEIEEIITISNTGWDTIRIMESDDYLIIGSGYGNTHHSLVIFARTLLKSREVGKLAPFILFHEGSRAYFNCEDISRSSHVPFSRMSRFMNNDHLSVLRDLVQLSDLSL